MTGPEKILQVSLIIPVYQGGDRFKDCVNALLELDYPQKNLQVIIVDDGSDDGTWEWLSQEVFPDNFTILRHVKNKGRAAARNTGIKQADGDVLIFLDADMLVKPDFASRHLQELSAENVEAVAGLISAHPDLVRSRLQKYLYEYGKRGAKQFGEKLPIPFQYLITGNMSVSRAALDAAGLFDESFQGYGGEDSLFAYKIWKTYPQGIRFSQKAGALDLHQYDLNLMLEKYHHYGRYNLPRLIRDFPETEKALHADWVTGSGPKRWIGRLFFNRPFYSVARWKMIFMPYPLSNWLIRYLIACAVITGLRSGLSNPSDM